MNPVQARAAGPQDAEEVARLNLLFNQHDEPAETYAARLSDPRRADTVLLAEVEGRAVGIAVLRLLQPVLYASSYAEVTELFVEEAFRGQGIGRALMRFAEDLARQAGAHEILVLTGSANHPAQDLYRSLGYRHEDIAFCKRLM
jgi:GNAT superfamily N-acetyltransferase